MRPSRASSAAALAFSCPDPGPVPLLVVGVGRAFERIYAPALRSLRGRLRVVAAVEPRTERAAWLNSRLHVPVYDSIEAALAAQRPAAALVTVPPPYQPHTTSLLLDAGLAALVEKPLARTPDEALALMSLLRRPPLRLALSRRFWPCYAALARSGPHPRRWRIRIQTNPSAWGAVAYTPFGEADLLDDLLPHAFDLARTLEPVAALRPLRVEHGRTWVRVQLDRGEMEVAHGDAWLERVEVLASDCRHLLLGPSTGAAGLRAGLGDVMGRLRTRLEPGRSDPVVAARQLLLEFADEFDRTATNDDLLAWAAFRAAVDEA
jgi:hypothetical protein